MILGKTTPSFALFTVHSSSRIFISPSSPHAPSTVSAIDFTFQVATIPQYHDSGSFRVVTGGRGCDDYTIDLSGLVTVPSTGDWGTFSSIEV